MNTTATILRLTGGVWTAPFSSLVEANAGWLCTRMLQSYACMSRGGWLPAATARMDPGHMVRQ